ncbi:AI-2E family transporter [Blastococcus sp. VKM Ac-2987]|uniref:AI-2E family transporter n=1 Tax=Blastococcus sp. VKM Ac-2987 TaxID=3004141 RepID=UPI0022AB787E|nr:AI-2E family transporter [Blastococcus sp. VKM Ac-2987]MCZ2856986.1 AI-2E family transporter [Blastococcus sp. VKM Ac-2987]
MTAEPRPDRPTPQAPDWLVRTAAVGGRLLVLVVLVWLLAGFAVKVTALLVAVLVGLLIAGVVAPGVGWAGRKGVPRWLAAGGAVLLILGVLAGAAVGLGVRIAGQLPQLLDQLRSAASELSGTFGVQLPGTGSSSGSGGPGGGQGAGQLLGPAQTVAEVLVAAFLSFALAFLFLVSGPDMWRWLLGKFGGRVREDVDAAGRAAWTTVGGYVRGLTIVAAFDALGIGIGLVLLGIPLALTLAAMQFLASYIPTIGAVVAGLAAVVVAYASDGLGTAALVLGLVVVVQQIGNDVIEPYVMKNRLPINAATVLVAVTAGGLLWGIPGALLFVPLTAAITAGAHEVWVRHGSPPVAGR